jgi:hypothetical protein
MLSANTAAGQPVAALSLPGPLAVALDAIAFDLGELHGPIYCEADD